SCRRRAACSPPEQTEDERTGWCSCRRACNSAGRRGHVSGGAWDPRTCNPAFDRQRTVGIESRVAWGLASGVPPLPLQFELGAVLCAWCFLCHIYYMALQTYMIILSTSRSIRSTFMEM